MTDIHPTWTDPAYWDRIEDTALRTEQSDRVMAQAIALCTTAAPIAEAIVPSENQWPELIDLITAAARRDR